MTISNRRRFFLTVLEGKRGCKCDPVVIEKRRPYRVQLIHQQHCPRALRAVP